MLRHQVARYCPQGHPDSRLDARTSRLKSDSLVVAAEATLITSQGQYLVGAHPGISRASKRLKCPITSYTLTALAIQFADASMISGQFELHLCMGKQAKLVTDVLGYRDLAFASDLHGITPTGKNTTLKSTTAKLLINGNSLAGRNTHCEFGPSQRLCGRLLSGERGGTFPAAL